jgi:RNA polymerase sigma-70 factor (ECF subfamily)
MTPSQSVEIAAFPNVTEAAATAVPPVHPELLEELWQQCDANTYSLHRSDFNRIVERLGASNNYGHPSELIPTAQQQAAFFHNLRFSDLVLAQACAAGNERAWEYFLELYNGPLTRAAIAIAGNETQGRDLVDALYAELYGLTLLDGERRCPLHSYKGRGSLLGWLRTILAQRHVDHHRRHHREQPLGDLINDLLPEHEPAAHTAQPTAAATELSLLTKAVQAALIAGTEEERFLLAAYYLDQRTLHQIAQVLRVHEATISRKLHRLTDRLRKQVLRNLQVLGLSKIAAHESLGTDPRDLDLNLKKILQASESEAFPEKSVP